MKTVSKINPELEYENAKKLIELASMQQLDKLNTTSLGGSVDNLMTAARVLMEREERRRGLRNPPKKPPLPKPNNSPGKKRGKFDRLPSKKFPEIDIIEKVLLPEETPSCPTCKEEMKESGIYDVSESLEVIPKTYHILRTKRVKFNCGKCHGAIVNTPALPSISPKSNYGDSVIIDVGLTKYCDLIPIERYSMIAHRAGVSGLPPQSLIGLTHYLANFLSVVLQKIKKEILNSTILLADETPHKMLEGDEKKSWYLWGFFSSTACYFEAHNTRSTVVFKDFLLESKCEYLVSDGYSAYPKAIREVNSEKNVNKILALCNAHSYRYFKEAGITWKEDVQVFLQEYGSIYKIERERKKNLETLTPSQHQEERLKMLPHFEKIKSECNKKVINAMAESSFKKALNYFLNHYTELTQCVFNYKVPLDNNSSERSLRSPVVGRKTWLGTHSKRGAKTNAELFSIVESCKLVNINPRKYFPWVVERIHQGQEVLTPYEYLNLR